MVDKKDLLILDALKRNAKASVSQISKETGLPGTTVHNRVKRLNEDGVITGYTIKVNHKKLGNSLAAYIAVTVDYRFLKTEKLDIRDFIREIATVPSVEKVDILTGDIDALVRVRVKNIEELNTVVMDNLRSYKGIEKTQTMVILESTMD